MEISERLNALMNCFSHSEEDVKRQFNYSTIEDSESYLNSNLADNEISNLEERNNDYLLTNESIMNKPFKILSQLEIDELKEEGFNDRQLEVIKSNYPIVNIAGPGSGKTKTLIAKITTQVESLNDLSKMLILTFTNAASNEVLERLSKKLNQEINRKDFYAGTFHGIFYKLLKENPDSLLKNFGFTYTPRILDSNEDKHLFETIVQSVLNKDASLKKKNLKEMFFEKHNIYPLDVYYTINNVINSVPSSIKDIKDKVLLRSESINDLDKQEILDIVHNFFKVKLQDNVLSFNDILMYTYFMLQKDESTKNKIQNQFKYILVDEYQDTNPIQAKILEMIDNQNNTCIIGDPYQSIYRFLGASVKNIIDKTKIDNMNVIQLTQNYRSTPNIVNFTNDISTLFREKTSKHKPCESAAQGLNNNKIELKEGVNQEYTILNSIQFRTKKGIDYKDMAILGRTNNETYAMEKLLKTNKIPFIKIGGNEFYESEEIKFMIDLAKVVSGDFSLRNLEKVADYFKGLGSVSIQKVTKQYIERKNPKETIADIISKDFSTNKSLTNFNNVLFGTISNNDKNNLFHIQSETDIVRDFSFDSFLSILNNENISFKEDILKSVETVAKKREIEDNINYFKNELQYYFSQGKDELLEFLSDVSLDPSAMPLTEEELENAITISTIHSAKGKEWNDVYVLNAEQGKFPSYRSIDPELSTDERNDLIEEEKRLLYVAVSRAKEKLMLTSSGELNQFIQPFKNKHYIDLYSKSFKKY